MKKLMLLIVAAMILLLCSGCSLKFRSIDTLMRPPLTATEEELEESIDNILGKNISLHSPSSGENHSAITLHDLDADSIEEAIVFYRKEDNPEVVRMSVLKKTSDGWKVVSDFAGNGSGVYSVDFHDLNNDGTDDMLVSWYLFEDRVNKTLTVYSAKRNGNSINFSACATEAFNLLCVADLLPNGEKYIVLAYTDSTHSLGKSTLRILKLNFENQVELLCETPLDNRVNGVSSLEADVSEQNGKARIFVDATVPGNNMITEVFVWNESAEELNRLISGDGQNYNEKTLRKNSLISYDCDSDGHIEIPVVKNLNQKNAFNNAYLLVWYSVEGDKLVQEDNYAVNITQNYKMYIPRNLSEMLYVRSEKDNSVWHFVTASNQELFSVTVYDYEYYVNEKPAATEVLFTGVDKVYTCNITDFGISCGVDKSDMIKYFSLNN